VWDASDKEDRMDKQKHVWIVVDKDGYTGHDFARNFCTDAFFSRSDARYDAENPCGKGRVVKYVPENKALVKAAREVLGLVREFEDDLLHYEIDYVDALEKALAKEDK